MRRPLVFGGVALVAVIAVIAAAAVVTGVVVATSDDGPDGPQLRVGEQFADPTATLASDRFVQLPAGRLNLAVQSVDTVPVTRDNDRELAPPSGGRVVRVRWAPAAAPTGVYTGPPTRRPTTISLVVGKRRYPLQVDAGGSVRADPPRGGAYVGIAGRAEPDHVEVGYDGVVQSLDLRTGRTNAGRAAPLYDQTVQMPTCGDPVAPKPLVADRGGSKCTVTATRTAYVDGLGWSAPGRAWLVVTSSVIVPSTLRARASSDALVGLSDRGTVGYRYDGRAVRQVGVVFPPQVGFGRIDGYAKNSVTLSVPARPGAARPFVITARLTASNLDGGSRPVTITWTTPIR